MYTQDLGHEVVLLVNIDLRQVLEQLYTGEWQAYVFI